MEWKILVLGDPGATLTRKLLGGALARADGVRDVPEGLRLDLGEGDGLLLVRATPKGLHSPARAGLVEAVHGAVLLLDHHSKGVMLDFATQVQCLREAKTWGHKPVVVGVTHDGADSRQILQPYREYLSRWAQELGGQTVPVFSANVASGQDLRQLMLALTAMMDFLNRFPKKSGTQHQLKQA